MNKEKLMSSLGDELESIVQYYGYQEMADGFEQAITLITQSMEGYSIVPNEPTEKMMTKGQCVSMRGTEKGFHYTKQPDVFIGEVYAAMIAAATGADK